MRKCMDGASMALKGRLTQQRYVCTVAPGVGFHWRWTGHPDLLQLHVERWGASGSRFRSCR